MAFCTSCGVARASESDRFCRACGQPHDALDGGVDTAPLPADAAASDPTAGLTPPPPAAVASPPVTVAQTQTQTPAAPPVPPVPAGPGRVGPAPRLLLAVFGTVLALGIGAIVAWQFLWPRGGAGSPEDAARAMIEAGVNQDPLALLDVIAPAEVAGFERLVEEVRDRAEEEQLLGEDRLTDAVEIELTDLEFDVDELGDDLARVALVGGDYEVSWDPDKLPDRLAFLRDASEEDSARGDIEDLVGDNADLDELYVMTVKVDGRWYVTALGTVAELYYDEAEDYSDVDRPDYAAAAQDVEPVTGEDPQEVIEGVLETVSRGNVDELLASLPDDLGKPLRPYVGIVEDILDGRYTDGRLALDIEADGLDLRQEDIGDGRVKVVIEGGTFTATASEEGYDADTVQIAFEGRCVTGTGEAFATYEYYGSDGYYDDYGNWVDGDEYREQVSDSQSWCFGGGDDVAEVVDDLGVDEYFVVMSETDGGYQLDPAATVSEYAALALDSLDGAMIDDLLDAWEDEL